MEKVKVWDPLVRIVHWTLVTCVIGNFAFNEAGETLHRWMGYTATGSVVLRVLWGFIGTPYAQFSDFFPAPSRLIPYLRELVRGTEPRMLGHTPLGALMMLTLMALVLAQGLTGFLMGTDFFWGDETMKGIHVLTADTLMILVVSHALAALIESIRHRENLVWSMVTGRKIK